MPFLSGFIQYILAVLFFITRTSATLTSCPAALCPSSSCTLGNQTLTSLGISPTNFNSTSIPPVIWTIGTSSYYQPEDSSNATFTRSFYLSSPSSSLLNTSASIKGCALFLTGLANTGRVTTTDGTCAAAMTAQCVSDTLSLASAVMESMASTIAVNATNGRGGLGQCEALEAALAHSAPGSCGGMVRGGEWGGVVVRDLSGLEEVEDSDCHPTTDASFGIGLVESETISVAYDQMNVWGAFTNATVPVVTVFLDGNGKAEADMSCLKTVTASAVDAGKTSTVLKSGGSNVYRMNWVLEFGSLLFVLGNLVI